MELCPLCCIFGLKAAEGLVEVPDGSLDLFGLADVGEGSCEPGSGGDLGGELQVAVRMTGVGPICLVE